MGYGELNASSVGINPVLQGRWPQS